MSNKNSNFPSNQLNSLNPADCAETVTSLRELAIVGKPKTEAELEARIDKYFEFCETRGMRPGIESMCLALGVTRQTLWRWANGINCSEKWQETVQGAKQFILTFLEQMTLTGKLNPASSIFYLKNWGNYKDSITLEDTNEDRPRIQRKTPEEIALQYGIRDLKEVELLELPEMPD